MEETYSFRWGDTIDPGLVDEFLSTPPQQPSPFKIARIGEGHLYKWAPFVHDDGFLLVQGAPCDRWWKSTEGRFYKPAARSRCFDQTDYLLNNPENVDLLRAYGSFLSAAGIFPPQTE